ncbi:MAG: hypothetical protein LUC31_03380 [Coprobacillus sp.]|nr:hypothetical protein [Coprobacillus sp.]
METITKKFSPHNVETLVNDMTLFGWKEIDRTFSESEGKYMVTLERETDGENFDKIVELEKKWNALAKPVPLWPIWIFLIPALVLLSVYLGLAIGIPDTFNTTGYYCAFFIPSGVLLVSAVVYSGIRLRIYNKNMKKAGQEREKIILELEEIKHLESEKKESE